MLQKIANTIRHLTMDAVERAGSGHPGMPMRHHISRSERT